MSVRKRRQPGPGPGEFELIARLAEIVGVDVSDKDLLVGIGDDAAVVRRGELTDIYTTDTMVDGVHFSAGQIPWRDLGWKSIAVNLSDIAAMGGRPLYSMVTLGVPPGIAPDALFDAYRGMADATSRFGGRVVGGDVVRSPVLFITVAMVGTASSAGGKPVVLTRSGAGAGDQVAVTGRLGDSAGGLRVAQGTRRKGKPGKDASALLCAHYTPVPRIAEGQALVRAGVRAAMDVSDGLVADLGKLCTSSGVRGIVHADLLPVSKELKAAFPSDFLQLALGGGEDYELLFTAPPDVMRAVLRRVGPASPTVIGEIQATDERSPRGAVSVLDGQGREIRVAHAGWDHLVG
jgi:thiamine-monophosphate kinase